jgi:hypothetical protein
MRIWVLLAIGTVLWAQPGARQFPGPRGQQGQQPRGGQQGQPSAAQPAQPSKPEDLCTLEGQVVSGSTGEPLRKATLILRPVGSRGGAMMSATGTDASGHFLLKDLEPGRYRLSAERNGFVRQDYSSRGPGKQPTILTLDKAQKISNLTFKLIPHGVITGRVVDEDGDPVARASIQALRWTHVQGRRQLVASGGSAQTDDLGQFRLFGVPPGRYFVSASYQGFRTSQGFRTRAAADPAGDSGPAETYTSTYYPGAPELGGAAPVQVAMGAQVQGIDFTLRKTLTVRVRGHVTFAVEGAGRRGAMVRLSPRGQMAGEPMRNGARPDAQGNFEIRGVAPGSYMVSAESFGGGQRLAARAPIEVGHSNVDDIHLVVGPGANLSGVVRVDGKAEASLGSLKIGLQPREAMPFGPGGSTGSPVKEDGVFTVENVTPDRYDVTIQGLAPGFYLKSMRWGNEEVLATGLDLARGAAGSLEVLISPAGGQVEGIALDPQQQPAAGATVVLFPDAERIGQLYLFKSASTDQVGHYVIQGLAPGQYRLLAFEDLESGAAQDAEYLKPFESSAVAVTIKESVTESKQLKCIPAENTLIPSTP